MSDEPESLVLRYLRRIDEKVDRLDGRVAELTIRQTETHAAVIGLRRDQVHDAEVSGHLQVQVDQIRKEVDRIMRRLDIAEA